jgi:hypothetical protein
MSTENALGPPFVSSGGGDGDGAGENDEAKEVTGRRVVNLREEVPVSRHVLMWC